MSRLVEPLVLTEPTSCSIKLCGKLPNVQLAPRLQNKQAGRDLRHRELSPLVLFSYAQDGAIVAVSRQWKEDR